MRSIGKLFTAFVTLADSLLALAGLVDIATDKLRQQLTTETGTHIIEHEAGAVAETTRRNGKKTAAV
jgi:hypothetical protein